MSVSVNIEKRLGAFNLRVAFEAAEGVTALLGASGCGKSLTLKCIAGIETPNSGRIVVDGEVLFDSERGINLPPQERRVGLMFQNYALFPNMTVRQNIRAGARRERDKIKRAEAIERIVSSFGLGELAERYPHQLSGGQQQRVALARILVSDPRILLLDEPFSALDSHLRFRLEQEVRGVIRSFGKPVLLVSHDRDEVYRMADSIAVMSEGRIEAFGAKKAVFASPETRMGAMLTGCKNISAAERLNSGEVYASDWGVRLKVNSAETGEFIGIRMHDIRPGEGENAILCRVVEVIENPFSYIIMLRPKDGAGTAPLGWETDKATWSALRCEELYVNLPPEALIALRGES